MKLENIGFYTLSNQRAKESSINSPLYRCELLLTDKCNFNCPYCRKLKKHSLSYNEAKRILYYWVSEKLRNIRFSGGEPTLYPHLIELVKIARKEGIEHIAISTNGSASRDVYSKLLQSGVNDFSISLDACCSSTGDQMSGKKNIYNKIIENIKFLSIQTYVTVGIVITQKNEQEALNIIRLAHSLGVADIRIIPSAQYNKNLKLDVSVYPRARHPILYYRITNNRPFRGLSPTDSVKCKLVLDDMAVWNNEHYPCIIYLREGGKSIGEINKNTRKDRSIWYEKHNSLNDDICRKNCLDVCRDFNNVACEQHREG